MDTQTATLLKLALDRLTQRSKSLRFVAYSCGSAYKPEAQEELTRTEAQVKALRDRLLARSVTSGLAG